jgi:branched-subunit amino acid aminotransferase/4-amino-4-deoxychorismate lyase
VAEAAIANIGFLEGSTVVRPKAPILRRITMKLLDAVLPDTTSRPVRLRELRSFDGAFVCNARGIALVSMIDDVRLPDASARVEQLRRAYDAINWDPT